MKEKMQQHLETIIALGQDPVFFIQLGIALCAIILSLILAPLIKKRSNIFSQEPQAGQFFWLRSFLYKLRGAFTMVVVVLFLGIGAAIAKPLVGQVIFIKVVQSISVIFLLIALIDSFFKNVTIKGFSRWIGIPLALLWVFGWHDDVVVYLDSMALNLGNIRLSLFTLLKGAVLGVVFLWLGRYSNTIGQKAIRQRASLDIGTRELFAKLFEIVLFTFLFVLLLQLMGINLTTLAVLGGAIGVGLGFGLQQIAANFISGIIILLDRAIQLGDHIELEDGRFGTIREIKMRYTVMETYEGKEVMIPNETFISSTFTNWSHKDDKQRYSFTFSVAYDTDLHKLFDLVREVVGSHEQVLSGEGVPLEEQPDAEIDDFGDSGVIILVEFWMHGIDDGKNRVDADLKLMIWDALKENNIRIPFPQREVRILNPS